MTVDAFQWTGDLDAFERWFGSRCPVDFGGQISVPSGEGRYLRVWCGSWIIRCGERCDVLSDWAMRYMMDEYNMDLQKPPMPPGHEPSCATNRGGYRCDCSLSVPKQPHNRRDV